MTAPVASGWSGCRVGLAPTGKRRLSTAHTQLGHQPPGGSHLDLERFRSIKQASRATPVAARGMPSCGAGDPRNLDLVAHATDAQNLLLLADGKRHGDQLALSG